MCRRGTCWLRMLWRALCPRPTQRHSRASQPLPYARCHRTRRCSLTLVVVLLRVVVGPVRYHWLLNLCLLALAVLAVALQRLV